MNKNRMMVGEIAEATGLHVNTIRNYADRGVIKSKRDFRGWRFFPDGDKAIKRIKALLNGDIEL